MTPEAENAGEKKRREAIPSFSEEQKRVGREIDVGGGGTRNAARASQTRLGVPPQVETREEARQRVRPPVRRCQEGAILVTSSPEQGGATGAV